MTASDYKAANKMLIEFTKLRERINEMVAENEKLKASIVFLKQVNEENIDANARKADRITKLEAENKRLQGTLEARNAGQIEAERQSDELQGEVERLRDALKSIWLVALSQEVRTITHTALQEQTDDQG